jgi:hypothetical protein
MINERLCLIWRRMPVVLGIVAAQRRRYPGRPRRGRQMSGMTAFMIAVGATSVICFLLMSRVQNRSARRSSAGDGSGGRRELRFRRRLACLQLVRRRQFHLGQFRPTG